VWGIAHLKQTLRQCWRQSVAAALKKTEPPANGTEIAKFFKWKIF